MTVTVFATRRREPASRFRQNAEAACQLHEQETCKQPEFIHGAHFTTSAGHFTTICDLLDLPNRVNEFDLEAVIHGCDATLLDLDGVLARLGLRADNREFHFRDILKVRDVAVVGISQGADVMCAY